MQNLDNYDSLTAKQKQWVDDLARTAVMEVRQGLVKSVTESVRSHGKNMPLGMLVGAESFALSVLDGTLRKESIGMTDEDWNFNQPTPETER